MQEFHEVDWDKKIEISKKFIDLSKKDFNSIQRGKIYNEFSTVQHVVYVLKENLFSKNKSMVPFKC